MMLLRVTRVGSTPYLHRTAPDIWNPPSQEAVLWRYMSLAKLISLLIPREDGLGRLFFPRADLLGDPFEGSLPLQEFDHDFFDAVMREQNRQVHFGQRRWAAISCWHASDSESAALWELYSHGDGAVCVLTSFAQLERAIDGVSAAWGIGSVQYIDYTRDKFPSIDATRSIRPLLFKRTSFSHEREVRGIIIVDPPSHPENEKIQVLVDGSGPEPLTPLDYTQEPPWFGFEVPVQVQDFITEIRVSPSAPEWIEEAVRSLVRQCGYDLPVSRSDLDADPIF